MRGIKIIFGTTALLAGLALAPAAQAQIYVDLGVQPVCSYGYYGYAPYACAPYGYYGPGYFYNGIFLGMGPWGGWGYSHGWGSHRFVSEGGGSYRGGPGRVSYNTSRGQAGGGVAQSRPAVSQSGGARPSAGHVAVARNSAPRSSQATPSRATASHVTASHTAPSGGGGGSRGGGGGGGSHGGGGHEGGGR